jgi:hypothetical protein
MEKLVDLSFAFFIFSAGISLLVFVGISFYEIKKRK